MRSFEKNKNAANPLRPKVRVWMLGVSLVGLVLLSIAVVSGRALHCMYIPRSENELGCVGVAS